MKSEKVNKARTAKRLARVSRSLIFILVFSMVMPGGWYQPWQAQAAISVQQDWTNPFNAASDPGTVAYTINAGTNRMLIVAVTRGTSATAAQTCSVTYGGQTMTKVAGANDEASLTRQHSWFFILNDAGIAAASNSNLVFTCTGGTVQKSQVFTAVFVGVDQSAPIGDAQNYNSGTAGTMTPTFGTSLTVGNGEQAVGLLMSMRTGSTTARTHTAGANWAPFVQNVTEITTVAMRGSVANRNITSAGSESTIGTVSSATTVVVSMSAISIKAVASAVAPTLTSPTASVIGTTTATLGGNVTADGGAAITARGTVWGTTAAPTGNAVVEGGTTTGVYTHARTGLTAGSQVFYRAFATNATGTGYSSDGSFYAEPATQASGVLFSGVTSTGMTVNWTRGTGNGVIVLMRSGSAVATDPTDGTYTGYTGNLAFGSGTSIGAAFVVYKGTGTSAAITGLSASTTYHVAVYEYAGAVDTAGTAQGTNYKPAAAINNQSTSAVIVVPTLATPTATSITNTTATLGANVTADGGAAITARGTVWGTTAAPTGNAAAEGGATTGVFTHARTGLTAGTLMYYRGYATNSAGTGYSSDGSFYAEPTTQASSVSFPSVTTTSMTVNWLRGSGNGVIVLMRAGAAVATDPTDGTYTSYTANAAFGSGTAIGAAFVVYKGTGTSATITGLNASTIYYVAAYEYTGTVDTSGDAQGTNYTLTPATGSQATAGLGPTEPTGIILSNMRTGGPLVSWNTVAGAVSYNVYRSTDGSNWGSTIGGVGAPTTSYADTAAPKPNTVYYWTVTTVNGGESTKPAGVSGRTALFSGYNMVSAPYDTSGQTPITSFGGWANWAWEWESSSNLDPDNSGTYVTPIEVTPGKGMFLWAYNDATILSTSGSVNPASVAVTLAPGWNMISNHTLSNMSNIGANWMVDGSTPLTTAVSNSTINGALSWWDGVQYLTLLISGNPTIEPWKAYFILNQTGVNHTLTIQ